MAQDWHNHSDSAINGLAKSGGLIGIGKKAVNTFKGTTSGVSDSNQSAAPKSTATSGGGLVGLGKKITSTIKDF